MNGVERADLLVAGAGPGGYAAAFMAACLGIKATLVDPEENPGGVCLYRGCIPSKALLHVAKLVADAREAKDLGVEFAEPEIRLERVREWKNGVVARLTRGLKQLCAARKVNYVRGKARFSGSTGAVITRHDGGELRLRFDHAIIATGSRPVRLPFLPSSPRVLDSTSALELSDIPERLLVIGGGYIGLELGTVYHELGSEVTVVEMTGSILPGVDPDLSGVLYGRIKDRFKEVMTGTRVTGVEERGNVLRVSLEDGEGRKSSIEADRLLAAVGRKPDTSGLGLDKTGVEIDERGFIRVDAKRRTADPRIYAIGDIAGEPMLAHKATHEGRIAAQAIAGKEVAFEPRAIPAVVFTDPEIAWCGLTEPQAREQGRKIKTAKFPWTASGRAATLNRGDGLTKLILDESSGRVLGTGLAGAGCGELIAEGALASEMGACALDLELTIHPHPTLSETIMEAAETASGSSTDYKPPAGE